MRKKAERLLCKNGHIVGEVCWNGERVPQVMVYRHAIHQSETAPLNPLGPVTGQMNIPCSICGETRFWGISIPAAIYLVENMPGKMFFDFWQALLKRAKVEKPIAEVNCEQVS